MDINFRTAGIVFCAYMVGHALSGSFIVAGAVASAAMLFDGKVFND